MTDQRKNEIRPLIRNAMNGIHYEQRGNLKMLSWMREKDNERDYERERGRGKEGERDRHRGDKRE